MAGGGRGPLTLPPTVLQPSSQPPPAPTFWKLFMRAKRRMRSDTTPGSGTEGARQAAAVRPNQGMASSWSAVALWVVKGWRERATRGVQFPVMNSPPSQVL